MDVGDIATLGVRVKMDGLGQATADLAAFGRTGEASASRFSTAFVAAQQKSTTAAQQSKIAYDSMGASVRDFARAGANAAQITQLTGIAATEARAAVQLYGKSAATTAGELAAVRLAQEEMALAGIKATEGAKMHGLQLGRLNMELGTFIGRLTGSNTAATRLGGQLGGAVAGYGAMIGVLAGVAGALEVYKAWHEDAVKARVEQDKLTESLSKWYEKQREGAAGEFPKQIEAMTKRVKDLRRELDGLADGKLSSEVGAVGQGGSKAMGWLRIFTAGDIGAVARQFAMEVGKGTAIATTEITKDAAAILAAKTEAAKRIREDAIAKQRDRLGDVEYVAQQEIAGAQMMTSVQTQLDAALAKTNAEWTLNAKQYERIIALNAQLNDAHDNALPKIAATNKQIADAQVVAAAKAIEIADKYADDIRHIWGDGFGKLFTDGLKSWNDFFEDVFQMFSKLMRRMEQEKKTNNVGYQALGLGASALVGGSIGYSSQNVGLGAIGGALAGNEILPGWGAVIGGFSGVIGGLLGAADAHRKAAAELLRAAAQAEKTKANYLLPDNGVARALNQTQNEFDDVLKGAAGSITLADYVALQNRLAEKAAKIASDFWASIGEQLNALDGPAGAYRNQLAAIEKQYADNKASADALNATDEQRVQLDALYKAQLDAIIKAEAERHRRIGEDLEVRRLVAIGMDDEAESLRRNIARRREFDQAVRDGYTATELATLTYVQVIEEERIVKEKAAAATERLARSFEDLTVRFLRLVGQSDAADTANLAAQQRRESADAVTNKATVGELAMLEMVHLFERGQLEAQIAIRGQTDTLNAQLKVQQDALSVAQSQLQALRQAADSLRTYRDTLKTGALSPLSPIDQLHAAQAQVESLFKAAQGGDAAAAGKFGAASDTYLQLARGYYASTHGYIEAFDQVSQMADTLAAQYADAASLQQQMVDALQTQITLLQQQIAQLQDAKTLAQATQAAVIAELQKNRDATLAPNGALIDQFNALRESLTGVGRDIVSAERDVLVGNMNAVNAATQAEIDAIQNGASAQTIATLDAVRLLDLQKTSVDDGFARQIAEQGKLWGFDSPAVKSLLDLQRQYDEGVQKQIDAINQTTSAVLGIQVGEAGGSGGGDPGVNDAPPQTIPDAGWEEAGAAAAAGGYAAAEEVRGLRADVATLSATVAMLVAAIQDGFSRSIASTDTIAAEVADNTTQSRYSFEGLKAVI